MKTRLSLADVDAVKAELLRLLPDVKSSHRAEAMARGLGWNTNAALRAELAEGPAERQINNRDFTGYLRGHGFLDTQYDALGEAVVRCKFAAEAAAVEAILAKEPSLSKNGYRQYDGRKSPKQNFTDFQTSRGSMLTPSSIDEFLYACEFLSQLGRRTYLNKGSASYGLKHDAERFFGARGESAYVSNGMFIVAAIHLGFKVKQAENGPNAYLNFANPPSESVSRRDSMLAKNIGGKPRAKAWRNMMIAAINEGLDSGVFGLDPDDNRWPGFDKETDRRHGSSHVYRFNFAGMPAIASVNDAGFGELSIHVALNPTPQAAEWITSNNAGLNAGDAFASGWLERKRGKWLQTAPKPSAAFRRNILPIVARQTVLPRGYEPEGPVIL